MEQYGVRMRLDDIKSILPIFAASLFMPSAFAQSFSNTSLDKQLGADNVSGTFLDTSGETGGGIETASTKFIQIVVAVCALVGFILVAKALYDLYTVSSEGRGGYMRPLITMIVGSALAILPYVTFVASNSVQSLT